jgi:hypothetical protein
MTSLSIAAVSRLSPEHPDSPDPEARGTAKRHLASAIPEDKVEISAKAKTKLLNKANAASEAPGLSATSRNASAAPEKPKLSEIDRAKLLKRQGDKIPQIAVILDVTPKTVENYIGVIDDSGTQSTTMIGKSGT